MLSPAPVKPLTPMMAQYHHIKKEYPDCLLFFRMGDFYELFFDDAVQASAALDITLTRRGKVEGDDIPMCGVPYHAVDGYLARLIKQGFRVAICDQTEEATKTGGKTLMKREVVRIVTPGTLTEDMLLEAKANNYLVCLYFEETAGSCAALDLSTGDFLIEKFQLKTLPSLLVRLNPSEVLLPEGAIKKESISSLLQEWNPITLTISGGFFKASWGQERLKELLQVSDLAGLTPLDHTDFCAIGGLLEYVFTTQKGQKPRVNFPKKINDQHYLDIDPATRRSFELFQTTSGGRKGSLLSLLDKTITSGGGRCIAQWLASPLTDVAPIRERHNTVAWFCANKEARVQVRQLLREVGDMERALSRLTLGRGGPRDLAVFLTSLQAAERIKAFLNGGVSTQADGFPTLIREALSRFTGYEALVVKLSNALAEELPLLARDGDFIKTGYDAALDETRSMRDNGKQVILQHQVKYASEYSIPTLKIKHNNILGYFIEVTTSHLDKVPQMFIHRQATSGAVRYTTVTLSELDQKMRAAADEALKIELTLFQTLTTSVLAAHASLISAAKALSELDTLTALAHVATEHNYTRPEMDDSTTFLVKGGRHPIVEAQCSSLSPSFIANDCCLDPGQNLWLMTGPNMAGKSTFLRQNGLMVIMAQMGGFVPAQSAHIGIVDKLFSRVGASDDLASGRSTFMVEMIETAAILNNATSRSLVILDEVGRGTATFDGMAIAWSVVENLGNQIRCRSLFATHYHELTALTDQIHGLTCHTMRIKEWKGQIHFLHEVIPGQADKSYGLHVASLAGIPQPVVRRAQEVLHTLEQQRFLSAPPVIRENIREGNGKGPLPLFDAPPLLAPSKEDSQAHALLERLKTLSPDEMTPREALEALYVLKKLTQEQY